MTLMFLNGTAMSGQKDHGAHSGSTFLGPAQTASRYRFFAIRDEFPGLYPVERDGRVIDGELYDIPEDVLRERLLPSEPRELEIGDVELLDGRSVRAMQLDINPDWPVFASYDPPPGGLAAPANGTKLLPSTVQGPWTFFESWWARDFVTMSARPTAPG